MKKHTLIDWIVKYILLLIFVTSLIAAGLGITKIVSNNMKVYISPGSYASTEDTGVLTDKQIDVYHRILDAAESGADEISIPPLTKAERNEILVQLGLYYGSMENAFGLVAWGENHAVLNRDLFREFGDKKSVIDARVDEAVANLYEGSDKFKLWQICRYLANRIDYTDGIRETIDGLNGHGVCCVYAMLFYKMATRLGIQTYMCYGYANGGYHAWNMVYLDGKQYFYDPTWYDCPVPDFRYVQSETPWGRDYTINRK